MDTSQKRHEEKVRHVQACLSPPAEKHGNIVTDDTTVVRNSPLSGIPSDRNSPLPRGKRDSGYVTDNSPATFSPYSQFTFDLPAREEEPSDGAVGGSVSPSDLSHDILDDMEPCCVYFETETDEDGDDSPFLDEVDGIGDGDSDDNETIRHDIDTIRNGVLLNRQISQPMAVPLSPPIADIARRNGILDPLRLPGRYCGVSSVGTQTPHVLSQMVHCAISEPVFMIQSRGTVVNRLRYCSDSEEVGVSSHPNGPLPDIIPHPRDRSISLPDMQALRNQRELEVGRELRRLSDEFNLNYICHGRRASVAVEIAPSNSFPGARRNPISGFVDIFRSIFLRSPSPLDEQDGDDAHDPS